MSLSCRKKRVMGAPWRTKSLPGIVISSELALLQHTTKSSRDAFRFSKFQNTNSFSAFGTVSPEALIPYGQGTVPLPRSWQAHVRNDIHRDTKDDHPSATPSVHHPAALTELTATCAWRSWRRHARDASNR